MISTLAVSGYRSLRDVRLELGSLNVVTGANGSGKSSLYRALRLLADAAQGRVVTSLAAEGGMASARWAGPKVLSRAMQRGDVPVQGQHGGGPVSLKLGFGGGEYGYAVDLGLPIPSTSLFFRDPILKAEAAWTGPRLKRSTAFARREGPEGRACCPSPASGALCPRPSARPTA